MRKWVLKIFAFAAAMVALNYPALFNGYPLLYSDSGTYIVAGFIHYIPVDRPFYYAWFVRHTSLWFSLWLVLFAQSILLFYACKLAIRYVLKQQNAFFYTSFVLIGLGLLTGAAYNNSQIIADVFAPIALLCFATLLCAHYIPRGHRFLLSVLLLFSISVHSSHLLIISCLALLLWLVRVVFKKQVFFIERAKAHKRLIILSFTAWLFVCLLNSQMGAGFKPSRTGNIFLVARAIETGVAKIYLEAHCPNAPADLCAVKHNLPPHAVAMLWDFESSPLYDSVCKKNGWGDCWIYKDREYGTLMKNMVLYGPSRKVLIEKCIEDSRKQLGMFDLGHLTPMAEGSPLYGAINDFFKREMPQYQNAVQYKKALLFTTESKIQRWVVYASLVLFGVFSFLCIKQKKYAVSVAFATTMVMGSIINGVVCASLSGIVDRYMARIIWLLPMAATLLVMSYFIEKRKLKKTSDKAF